MLRKCQGFIEKVGEIRFNKVKLRQVNKFNNLLRKEGNITGVSTINSNNSSRASQAGRQVPHFPGTVLLPRQSAQSSLTVLLPSRISPRKEAF